MYLTCILEQTYMHMQICAHVPKNTGLVQFLYIIVAQTAILLDCNIQILSHFLTRVCMKSEVTTQDLLHYASYLFTFLELQQCS